MCQMIRNGEFRDLTEARQCVIDSFSVKKIWTDDVHNIK